jgi:hypothetical protein
MTEEKQKIRDTNLASEKMPVPVAIPACGIIEGRGGRGYSREATIVS